MITQARLKERLHYDPETGIFIWLESVGTRQNFIGKKAGCKITQGYVGVKIDGKRYLAHRLAFLYMTGSIPDFCDHINRVCDDNRWKNLRPATPAQNQYNSSMRSHNTSGLRGVYWHSRDKVWVARLGINGGKKYLGAFECKLEAYRAYLCANREIYGEFSNV